jgi:hypothetical protein
MAATDGVADTAGAAATAVTVMDGDEVDTRAAGEDVATVGVAAVMAVAAEAAIHTGTITITTTITAGYNPQV